MLKPTLLKSLKGGLLAGAIAAILNVSWLLLTTYGFGYRQEVIHIGNTIGASLFPLVLGSLVFFLLSRFLQRYELIYMLLCIVLGLLSLGGSFQTQLPDGTTAPEGFALISAPMHLFAAAAAAFLTPRFAK